MKRAITLPAYSNVQLFGMPEGVMRVTIDPDTLQLATPECPITREEVYVHGTEPTEFCSLHGGHMASDAPPASGSHEYSAARSLTLRHHPLPALMQRILPPRVPAENQLKGRRSPRRRTKKVFSGVFLVSLEEARRTPTSQTGDAGSTALTGCGLYFYAERPDQIGAWSPPG